MNKEFVPYNLALELKELGFDEPCIAYYNSSNDLCTDAEDLFETINYNRRQNQISAPLYQQAFRWFRYNYWLDREIYMIHEDGIKKYHFLILELKDNIINWKSNNVIKFNTYEQAELACLNELIKIVKNK